MIVPLTHQLLEEICQTPVDPELPLRGFAYMRGGRVATALPVTPLEAKGWGSDGIIGSKEDPEIIIQLLNHVLQDLKSIGSRIFIVFDEMPKLQSAGLLHMLEARGHRLPVALETQSLEDNEVSAELLRACQVDSKDFEEIPMCDDSLDPYRGYGSQLWRHWENKAVLLINEINEDTNHLAFVGLKTELRNQGLGSKLLSTALSLTGPEKRLTTAVDARNIAACKMYRKQGFKITDVRKVFFKNFLLS